jgi:hypothetical protein
VAAIAEGEGLIRSHPTLNSTRQKEAQSMDESELVVRAKRLTSKSAVSIEELKEFMHSSDRQAQTIVSCLILDHPALLSAAEDPYICVVDLCVPFFLDSIAENSTNDEVMSRYEGAHAINGLFHSLWNVRPNSLSALVQMRQMLEQYVRKSIDPEAIDAVVLGTLEHCFQTPGIRALFLGWKDDPQLAPIFVEGCKLADGFRH